jgi:hypothetical protein
MVDRSLIENLEEATAEGWRCAFKGCARTSAAPMREGWAQLAGYEGLASGLYCPIHAEAIEAVFSGPRRRS